MVETQTKNQNIFWLWSDKVDLIKRLDVQYFILEKITQLESNKKISDFFDLISGYAFNSELFQEVGEIPVIKMTQIIGDGLVDLARAEYLNKDYLNKYNRFVVKKGDVLVALTGATIGKSGYYDKNEPSLLNQRVLLLRSKGDYSNEFLIAFCLTDYFVNNIIKESGGGARANISPFSVGDIKFLEIAEPTQRKVEQIVKEAFKLKKEAEEERRKADLILGNSIKEFFTIDKQRTFWKWSTDIEIIKTLEPNFWKRTISSKKHPTIKFGDIFNYQKGTEVGSALYQDNGIPFLRVSDLGNLEIGFGNSSKYINETLFDELKNDFQPHKGELLFSKDATIGLVAKVETEERQIISSGILKLQVKRKDFDADFLMALLTNKFINQEFVKNSTGSIIKHLNTQKLSEIELPLIDKQIQKEVANQIKSSISKKQLSKQKLQEAKDFVENLVKKG